ncbi:MAG: DUF4870 domain-containing protein [Candidatus Nanopelagicales bacterium]
MTEPGPGEQPPQPEPAVGATPEQRRDDERTWAVIAHLGGFVLAVVIAWAIRATVGRRSEFVRDQATEAMNFQLTAVVAFLISVVLWVIVIGLLLTVVVGIGALVLSVLAALAAHAGIRYRYPVCVRLIH